MKTTNFLILSLITLLLCTNSSVIAQATQPTNAITTGSYLGTSNNYDVVFKRLGINAGLISIKNTSLGLNSKALNNSVSIGINAGQNISGNGGNTFVGHLAGNGLPLVANKGTENSFYGLSSGEVIRSGSYNCFFGAGSGSKNQSGSNNVFIGYNSGFENADNSRNICIGSNSGLPTSSQSINDQLFVDNSSGLNPLIWGDFAADKLKLNGKVGIGGNSTTGFGDYPTTAGGVNVSTYQLFVKGGILTEEVRVSTTWADYVFNKDYTLKSLNEVEQFINDNGHLPNVPSAAQVEEEGIELGEMAKIQQEKIEELTLYIIEQNKVNEKQTKEIEELKSQVKLLLEIKK